MFRPEDIKKIRLTLMLTQQEFAKLLGVVYETVNRYENGKSKPTLKMQRKLHELYDKLKARVE